MEIVGKVALTWLLLFCCTAAEAQCTYKNRAFKSGEYLAYNTYFNWKFVWVKVGNASMSTVQTSFKGKPAYRSSLITRGNKNADKLFVLRDTLLCYASTDLSPLYYRKGAQEGDRYYIDEVFYTYPDNKCHIEQHQVTSSGEHLREQHTLNECVFDMMNIFLRARSFDPTTWKKGNVVNFTIADGHNITPALLKFHGTTNVKADNGRKYRCLQLSYMELEDGKYKRIVDFFVTDDANHIPVRLDMFLRFGSAKAFLVGMQGMRNSVTAEIK